MKPIKVLIVDDNEMFRGTVKKLLGFEPEIDVVGEAENGEEAIQRAKALMPNIILMDISLPKMNGIEATRCTKKLHPSVGIIMLSVHDNKEYRREAKEAGAQDYLLKKDLSRELLAEVVEKVYQGQTD